MASDKSEISSPASPAEQTDHPYLTFLHKRMRSHRKKLEKIRALELKDRKQLNAQQLELVGTKAVLEKLLVELETLREQFVQLQEQEQQAQAAQAKAKDEELNRLKQELATQQEQQVEQQVEQETEQRDPFSDVHELLKALHVVNLHQALGKDVPMVLDFFEKVLRGNTRPPAELSYEENLAESMEEATKYLTGSDKVFACDTTYSGLRAFVDELASGKSEEAEEQEAEQEAEEAIEQAEETPEVPAEVSEPQINFFTESQLEQDEEQTEADEPVETEEPAADAVEIEDSVEESTEQNAVVTEEQVEVAPAPEAIPSPPLSFAAVAAAGLSAERTPSPAPSGAALQKGAGSEGNSPRGKNNQRRRGQGRWREKGSSSSGNKSGNGSPTNGGKPRRPRGPRPNADNAEAQGGKTKEGRRPRIDRALRKQGNNAQPAAPMIAPHA